MSCGEGFVPPTNPESITRRDARLIARAWLADVYAGAAAFANKIDPDARKPPGDHLLAALDGIKDLAWRERAVPVDDGIRRWPKALPTPAEHDARRAVERRGESS